MAQISNKTVQKKLVCKLQTIEKERYFESVPKANQGQQIDFLKEVCLNRRLSKCEILQNFGMSNSQAE